MSHHNLLALDLSINIIFAALIITLGILLLTKLRIRLNLGNKIKWSIAAFSLLLRLGISISDYSRQSFSPTAVKYYLYWILEQSNFMIMLMLFLTVIGSWQIVSQFNPRNNSMEKLPKTGVFNRDKMYVSTLERLKQEKKVLNKRIFILQGIFGLISLTMTIELQIVQSRIEKNNTATYSQVPNSIFYNIVVLTILICLFEIYIGVLTTLSLHNTDVQIKWPIYLSIWVLLLSYLAVQILQTFLYTYKNYTNNTYVQYRLLASTIHNLLIYLAILLIIWHTYRINKHTIKLVKSIE